jgi:hypothetical protein
VCALDPTSPFRWERLVEIGELFEQVPDTKRSISPSPGLAIAKASSGYRSYLMLVLKTGDKKIDIYRMLSSNTRKKWKARGDHSFVKRDKDNILRAHQTMLFLLFL